MSTGSASAIGGTDLLSLSTAAGSLEPMACCASAAWAALSVTAGVGGIMACGPEDFTLRRSNWRTSQKPTRKAQSPRKINEIGCMGDQKNLCERSQQHSPFQGQERMARLCAEDKGQSEVESNPVRKCNAIALPARHTKTLSPYRQQRSAKSIRLKRGITPMARSLPRWGGKTALPACTAPAQTRWGWDCCAGSCCPAKCREIRTHALAAR